MARSKLNLPAGHSFNITLRCHSWQLLVVKVLRIDVLLAVLAKAKSKVLHRLCAARVMANHLSLLLPPHDASQFPSLMHWIGLY